MVSVRTRHADREFQSGEGVARVCRWVYTFAVDPANEMWENSEGTQPHRKRQKQRHGTKERECYELEGAATVHVTTLLVDRGSRPLENNKRPTHVRQTGHGRVERRLSARLSSQQRLLDRFKKARVAHARTRQRRKDSSHNL